MRPTRWSRITNKFAAPGSYSSGADEHGPAGHHTGVDFGKHLLHPFKEIEGLPVRSILDGVVTFSSYNLYAGNWVGVYSAEDDVVITYWHLALRRVTRGDAVQKGDVIGKVGNTGKSTAPHLHVQANHGTLYDYHAHVNPGRWLKGMAYWRKKVKRSGAH